MSLPQPKALCRAVNTMQCDEKSPLLHTKLTKLPLTQTPLGVGLRDKYTTFFRSEQRSINKIKN